MKRKLSLALIFCMLGVGIIANAAFAEEVDNNSAACSDLLIVFARGSSSNNEGSFLEKPFEEPFSRVEAEAGEFFRKFKHLLDINYPLINYKAQSVHDFPGKYNWRGYPAPGIFGPKTILNNAINAEVTWWAWGDYQGSVKDGKEEVAGYVKDQVAACPDQMVVMGGYSQGAQVIGESLFLLNEQERSRVEGVALFGDPKYIGGIEQQGSEITFPWKRGTAELNDQGIAEARVPYVPEDMYRKTLSWCFDDDPICAGFSGIRYGGTEVSEYAPGHTRYSSFGIQQAADEIFQMISPKLYAINKNRGGFDKDAGPAQPVAYQPPTQPIDVMFVVDVSYNIDDVLGTLRTYVDNVVQPLNTFFPGVRYGIADVSENFSGTLFPRYNYIQDLKVYNQLSGNLHYNFNRRLSWGGPSGGGVDRPDPLGMAVEKTVMRANWYPDAIKHIVLITDRPAKDPYTYNICDGMLPSNIGLPQLTCTTNPSNTTLSTKLYPELCDTVRQVILRTECTLGMEAPGAVHNITRRLNDAVSVAQSKRVAVSVVVPHELKQPTNPTDTLDAAKQLEYFAKATAGLYLKYDIYSRASFSDTLWQVLNHRPKDILLAYKDALDVLGHQEKLVPGNTVTAKAGVPTMLDVSQSNVQADSYKWDFDGDRVWDKETAAPNVGHVFGAATDEGFMSVAAFDGGEQIAERTLPLTVVEYEGPIPDTEPLPLPPGIKGLKSTSGAIEISWETDGMGGLVVIADPYTGLPLVSVPRSAGSITVPSEIFVGSYVHAFTSHEGEDSEPTSIEIAEMPLQVNEDPKKPLAESDPEGQYVEGNVAALQGSGTQVQIQNGVGINQTGDNEQEVLALTDNQSVQNSETLPLQGGASSDNERNSIQAQVEPKSEQQSRGARQQLLVIIAAVSILLAIVILRRRAH